VHAESASANIWQPNPTSPAALVVASGTTYYTGSSQLGPRTVPANAVGSDINGAISVSSINQFTGNPGGTMTIEVSNSSDDDIRKGLDLWDTDDTYQGGGFVNGVATVTAGAINGSATWKTRGVCRYRRQRFKFACNAGAGTVTGRQTIKRY
jgi:hypothetical protein